MIAIPRSFRNTFYAMRHGQSEANSKSLIASDPRIATQAYGLTPHGKVQATQSACALQSLVSEIHFIYTSDFLRAVETADAAHEVFPSATLSQLKGLRERFFGCFDQGPDSRYKEVWIFDAGDGPDPVSDVESADHVATRMLRVIRALEESHADKNILIVSHGDPLDILFAVLQGFAPGDHRRMPFSQAEIRPFPIPCPT